MINSNLMLSVLVLTGTCAVAQESKPEEPTQSVFEKAYGKSFERNSILLAMSLSKSRPSPSDILKEPDVVAELGLSQKQTDELADLTAHRRTFPEIMAITGLGDAEEIASRNEKQIAESGGSVLEAIQKDQAEHEQKVKDILTPKQYKRMKQIFLQNLLLLGIRNQVAEFIGVEGNMIVELNLALDEVDREIAKEIQKLKFRRYLEKFDEYAGPGTSLSSFGAPFYVDFEPLRSRDGAGNPRRE